MPSDVIRGWVPVRVKKTRLNKRLEPPFRFNRNDKALERRSLSSLLRRKGLIWMGRVRVMQHQGKLVQLLVAKAFGLDRLHGRQHIVAVAAGLSMSLQHVTKLLGH